MKTPLLSAPWLRRYALVLGGLLGAAAARGQNLGYTPANATTLAGTYTDLGSAGTAISTANTDDANSTAQNIGFMFNFNGTAFTQFVLNTNGLLRLGASPPSSAAACSPYGQQPDTGPINSSNAADVNLLLPFNCDLTAGTSTPEYRVYTTTDAVGSRVCTVQWKNVADKAVATSSSDATSLPTQYTNFSFQVKLYEGSNRIEYVYAAPTAGLNDQLKYAVVGLKGSGNASGQTVLASKTSRSAWSTTAFATGAQLDVSSANANNFRANYPPDAGRTYRFTVTAPANDDCTGAVALASTATCTPTSGTTVGATQSLPAITCNNFTGSADDDVWYKFVATATSHTVTVVGSSTFDAVVDVRSGACPGTNIGCADATVSGGTETVTLSGLTPTATYFVRVYSYGTTTGTFTICVMGAAATCAGVTNVATSNPTSTATAAAVNITFTPATSATSYYVTLNQTGSTSSPATGTITSSPLSLSGLTPNTSYTVTFTTNCSNGGTSSPVTYVFTTPAASTATPPANNDCAGATALTVATACAPITGTTVGATQSLAAITCGGYTGDADDDVWYKFVATAASNTVTVVGSTYFDPVVDVRSGACASTTNIGCADATLAGGTETVVLSGLTPNATYFVRVYDFSGGVTGTFTICVTGPPLCSPPTGVSATSITTTTANATFMAGSSSNTSYTATATPSTGSPVSATGTASPIALTGLMPGTTYSLVVAGNCGPAGASTAVSFTTLTPPANDDCTGAVALTSATTCTPTNGTTVGATASTPASVCAGTADDDVWYSFVAGSASQTITVVGSSNFDAVVQLLSGTCAGLTSVSCANATNTAGTETIAATGLTKGATYYVRVYEYYATGSSSGAPGPFTICVTQPGDLVVDGSNSSPGSPYGASGSYNNVTINNGGTANLSDVLTVAGTLTINSGGTLNTGSGAVLGAGSFVLAAGGTLGIGDAAGISSSGATGAIRTTGPTRSFSTDASYIYNGTAAQSTGGGLPAQVRSLTTTNSNNVTLAAPTSATQVVTVGGSGNLALNGQALTLLSSASGTALIVNSGTGLVTGATGVAQRYLSTTNQGLGYRHYAAPVSNTTVADLATSGFAPEVSQAAAYNNSATPGTTRPYPTVFGYDQSRLASTSNNLSAFDKGWYVPAGLGTPLAVGQGYAVQIAGTELVDFVGTFTSGSQTMSLSRGPGADAGLALVGNPYPAPIDWSLLNALTDRPGVDGALYVFASSGPYAGSYRSYANGMGGNPVVPMGQGFFVRVTPGQTSASLTFSNAHRLTAPDATPMQRPAADPRPLVQLELAGAALTDALYAYAQAGATPGLDGEFDAEKLPNPTGLNLGSLAASGQTLAIDGRPAFTASTALPLAVGVPAAGTYALSAAALNNLPAGLDAYLRDAQTGQTMKLRVGVPYSFGVTAAQATSLLVGRFTLLFSPQTPLATALAPTPETVRVFPNPSHGRFAVVLPGVVGTSTVQAELLNPLGQVVRRQAASLPATGTTLTFETGELATGVYILRLTAGPTVMAQRVVIQ